MKTSSILAVKNWYMTILFFGIYLYYLGKLVCETEHLGFGRPPVYVKDKSEFSTYQVGL